MHEDAFHNGRSDFMCTNAVQYLIRNNKMHCVVQMRSNDVVFGYRNDRAWQKHVLDILIADYNRLTESNIEAGDIHWNVGSLHIYERHFKLVEDWYKP
jgi:thymidylate synthase